MRSVQRQSPAQQNSEQLNEGQNLQIQHSKTVCLFSLKTLPPSLITREGTLNITLKIDEQQLAIELANVSACSNGLLPNQHNVNKKQNFNPVLFCV